MVTQEGYFSGTFTESTPRHWDGWKNSKFKGFATASITKGYGVAAQPCIRGNWIQILSVRFHIGCTKALWRFLFTVYCWNSGSFPYNAGHGDHIRSWPGRAMGVSSVYSTHIGQTLPRHLPRGSHDALDSLQQGGASIHPSWIDEYQSLCFP